MIQATNIVKRFGELEVLRGVDLTVNAGEIVSIVGASGAGKTTLLQILGTLDLPDAGEVSIGGQSTAGLSRRELSAFRNAHLGFVFQFHRLLPEFNALENVLMPAWIAGKSTDESRVRARQLLEELGMGHRIEHNPSELSGGEQQRVAVARALMNRRACCWPTSLRGIWTPKTRPCCTTSSLSCGIDWVKPLFW